ncbi:MAG: hypothetical protein EOP83_33200 [Verrucomicrobiaceae bacterium]|nr:MAG: hypothetical protein EOP83_33200 [Verrucomicrobiaceae bacterium]
MNPAALSTIIFRFIALGVAVYGIVLIVSGVVTHMQASQMANMATLFDAQPHDSSISFGSPFTKVAATLYLLGGGTVLAGSFLYLASRRLGALIARDL